MAIIEEGKAAKRSDQFLDEISRLLAERDDLKASYEWKFSYACIMFTQLAKTASDDQIDVLMDLVKVFHNGGDE